MANTSGWFESTTEKDRQKAEDCGRLVEIVRHEEGLTRAQLASAADVSEEDVDRFESGRTFPVEPMLSTLLRAMGRTS
jgi:ribosome-binding protein aMBF1 (putative translation factor)